MIMAPGETIGVRDLPPGIRGKGDRVPEGDYPTLREARIAFEKRYIERKLAEMEGNVTRTAEALGLERSHLYRKMRAYGIES
jgi:two-component system, NtrC family, nitrogen regulation response regulator NtrX